jgi:hypothetical protein
LGDLIVIDPSQNDILDLEGQLVAAIYVPDEKTAETAKAMQQGRSIQEYFCRTWPLLPAGVYVGWVKTGTFESEEDARKININSAKIVTGWTEPEFCLPVAEVDERMPGKMLATPISETKLLGRVVCWMAGDSGTSRDESAAWSR